MADENLHERYQRQVILKGFGEAAQNALLQAKVLVIGAGGLGCPVLQYLTAAGTGCIGIVDDDMVSITNLHRQVLFDSNDIGKSKVQVASEKLHLMNPDTELIEYKIYLDKNNCLDIISGYDVVVDCTDNFSSRYMINDACVLKGKPLIFAAVSGFEGQVAVFNVAKGEKERTGNYRDLFPHQPGQGEVMNCAEAGVLGVLPGIIGSMQALEVIKLITGVGEPLVNQLLTYNAINNRVAVFEYHRNILSSACLPSDEKEFLEMDYKNECIKDSRQFEIDAETFDAMLSQKNTRLVDVREFHELPLVNEFEHTKITLAELRNKLHELGNGRIIFFCQSGIRSQQAAAMAAEYFGEPGRFFSLQGGILSWKELHAKQMT